MKLTKIISGLLSVSTSLTFSAVGLATTAYGAPLTEGQVSLSDSRSTLSSSYTITAKLASTNDIKGIRLRWRIAPSNTSAVPTSLATNSSTVTTATVGANNIAAWTYTATTTGEVTLTNATGITGLAAGNVISIALGGLSNNDATVTGGNQCDAVAESESCYVVLETFTSDTTLTAPNLIDSTVMSYTVLSPITVTATVDPSLTLTVGGVAGTTAIQTNDSNAGCVGAADVTTTATSIPLGNIRVNTAKCAQQSLAVATNAQFGYSVYAKFIGASAAANMMQGTNAANNIDPYTAAWGSASALTTPTGTVANVNSAWLGMRTTNANVTGFGTTNFYSGPEVNNTATFSNKVMDSTGPDLGTAPSYVTLKLLTNAMQQSDTYTGTMVYAATAKY